MVMDVIIIPLEIISNAYSASHMCVCPGGNFGNTEQISLKTFEVTGRGHMQVRTMVIATFWSLFELE